MLAIKHVKAIPKTITRVYFFKLTVSINLPVQIIVMALRTVAIE